MKVLILKPSALGDIIHALPVLRLLKAWDAKVEVDWWIEKRFWEVLEGDPHIGKLILFDRKGWVKPKRWPEVWSSVRSLQNHQYDVVLDLQGLARSSVLSWLVRGELTIGIGDYREGAPMWYDRVVDRPSSTTHIVEWYASTLKVLGLSVQQPFDWLPCREPVRKGLLEKWPGQADYRWLAIQPGAGWVTKMWPVASFRQLTQRIVEDFPEVGIAVFGGNAEKPMAEEILANIPKKRGMNWAGSLGMADLIEGLRLCDAAISHDTGATHIAAALKVPVVALFGPTSPARSAPYGEGNWALQETLPCVPCMKYFCVNPTPMECFQKLSVDRVYAAVKEALNSPIPNEKQGRSSWLIGPR